jgi:Holliday junction resolvase RusA-like endonuclease
MSEVISFRVYDTPKALKRHRTVKTKAGFNINYDPSTNDKQVFLDIAIDHRPPVPIDKPIKLICVFYFPRPKSHYGTGKNSGKLKESAPKYHTIKPDLDNLVKFCKDAMSGIFYRDDSLVYEVGARKEYTEGTPNTLIKLDVVD